MPKYFPKAPFPNSPKRFTWGLCLGVGVVGLAALIFNLPTLAAWLFMMSTTTLLIATAAPGI